MEHYVAAIVVAACLIAALVLGYRQMIQLRRLKGQEAQLSEEDRVYYRWSTRRRVTGCILLLVLAAMLAGLYLFDIAAGLEDLAAIAEQARGTGQKMTPEQRAFVYRSMIYVGTLLLVVCLLLGLASWDILAIRRYGMRHRQRIRDDRRAMLERQLPLLYAQRRARGSQRDGDDSPPPLSPPY
jgi:hypothetical protein